MAVKGSKTKLKKSLSPQEISRARNEATKFTQKLERSVVQYPTVPQKRPGKSKSLTSQAKVMKPEKVTIRARQNPKTGKVGGSISVGYHSRPSASGKNGTRRVSGGSVPKIQPKNASKIEQQKATLRKELVKKTVTAAGVITGGQIKPKSVKGRKYSSALQSGLVEKHSKKKRKR